MRDRIQIKALAKPAFKAQWASCFVICLIYGLIANTLSSFAFPDDPQRYYYYYTMRNFAQLSFIASLGTLLIRPVLDVGLSFSMLEVYTGRDTSIASLFSGFKRYGRNLGGMLWQMLFVFLWSLLFVIPGIVKSIAYSMTPFILADSQNVGAREAVDLSKRITQGHKGELFVMSLSFLGWGFLWIVISGALGWMAGFLFAGRAAIIAGAIIGSAVTAFHLLPYMQTTFAGMYLELKQEALSRGTAAPEEFA